MNEKRANIKSCVSFGFEASYEYDISNFSQRTLGGRSNMHVTLLTVYMGCVMVYNAIYSSILHIYKDDMFY